jgi:hypothetical protein
MWKPCNHILLETLYLAFVSFSISANLTLQSYPFGNYISCIRTLSLLTLTCNHILLETLPCIRILSLLTLPCNLILLETMPCIRILSLLTLSCNHILLETMPCIRILSLLTLPCNHILLELYLAFISYLCYPYLAIISFCRSMLVSRP